MSQHCPPSKRYMLLRILRHCPFWKSRRTSRRSETKDRSAPPKGDAKHRPACPDLKTKHHPTSAKHVPASSKHVPASPNLFQTQSHHEPGVSKQVPKLRIITKPELPTEEPRTALRAPSCRPRFNLDQKPGEDVIIHGRKSSRGGQQNKSPKSGRSMSARKKSRKDSLRSKSLAATPKPKVTLPQGKDRHKSLHFEQLSNKPKLKAITPRKVRPRDKRRQEMDESKNNSLQTPSRSRGNAPTFGRVTRVNSCCPPRPAAAGAKRVHKAVGEEDAQTERLRRLGLLKELNTDIANRSKLQRSRGSGALILRPDRSSVVPHLSSLLSPVLSTVLSMDSEPKKIDEPNLRRSRSLGSLIFEPNRLGIELHSAPSKMKPEREKTDEATLRSPSSLGTMIPHPELPPVAQHLNFTRPSSATNMQQMTYPGFLTPYSTTPIPRPSSTTYLHTQIRHVQHQLQSRTEEVWQLKRKLEAHDHTEIGTLSQQLREGKREVQMWKDRAEAAERRVKVFERFTARLSGMKLENT